MTGISRGDRRRDTLVLAVSLPLCMAVGPLMLYTLAAVSPLVIEDLEMSDAQYGAVSAVTFISAAGGAFFLGGQSARFTARHVMMGIAIGSGVSLGLLAAAVPAGALSSATGAMVTAMYFGFATGPLGFGLVLHYGATFHAGWLLPLCSFAVAALVGLPQLSFSRRGNSASHATHNL